MRDKEDHGSATVARRVGGSGQTDAAKIRVSGAGGDAAVASVVSGENGMCVKVRRDNGANENGIVIREVI